MCGSPLNILRLSKTKLIISAGPVQCHNTIRSSHPSIKGFLFVSLAGQSGIVSESYECRPRLNPLFGDTIPMHPECYNGSNKFNEFSHDIRQVEALVVRQKEGKECERCRSISMSSCEPVQNRI